MNRVLLPLTFNPPAALPAGARLHAWQGETMGTSWQVQAVLAREHDPAALQQQIQTALDMVIAQMSTWQDDSDLSQWNRAPAGTWQSLPQPFFDVLQSAIDLAQQSQGAYDPTVGPLVNLWGFGPAGKRSTPPQPAEIEQWRQSPRWPDIALDIGQQQARQPGGAYVDLSSIAKGYAVDLVAESLNQAGVISYLVEIGGELKGLGTKLDQQPWWVELEQPPAGSAIHESAALAPMIAGLHEMAIATSGDYRKFFEYDGHRYSHTIDPRTGWPVDHSLAVVTVLDNSCMRADGYATALMVLGVEDGLQFAEQQQIAARFVAHEADGYREYTSTALEVMLE